MYALQLYVAEETPFVYKFVKYFYIPDEFSKKWSLLAVKNLEITICGSNWDRKTAGRKVLWNLPCRDVLNVSATERLQQKALNTIKKTPGNFNEDPDFPVFQTLSDVLLYWNLPPTQDNWTTNVQL